MHSPRRSARSPACRRAARAWVPVLSILVIAVIVGLLAIGWLHRMAAASKAAIDPAETAVVKRGTVEKSVESAGKVVANLEVDIKCRASGEIITLPFDISDKVKKGDLLCQLDPTDEQLAVDAAQVAVEVADAKLAQARYTLDEARENLTTTRELDQANLASAKVKADNEQFKTTRQQELFDKNLSSKEDLETQQTTLAQAQAAQRQAEIAIEQLKQQEIDLQFKDQDVKMAQAQLESSQISLKNAQQQLGYTKVMSPIDGTVSALSVQKGTIVASGMSGFSGGTTIMTLSDLSHIFMTATVDESDIGQVEVGQAARIKVASFPNRAFTGKVVRKATKGVNTSNVVTFEVKVEVLDDHKDLLQPEMTGTVTIIEASAADVLEVPEMAIDREGAKAFVTTTTGQRKEVTLGLEGTQDAQVLSGVSEGDHLLLTTAELPTRWKSNPNGPPPR
ncbi:MAG TPA: efflux RND transporter periplasmic adaptor subunit [Phycisphaerae bacterium]|nr:efflux RND transporter periplasmic adaptor subunit [Phycisphaerae bacterium]